MSSSPETRNSLDTLSAAEKTEENLPSSLKTTTPPQTPPSPILHAAAFGGQTAHSTRAPTLYSEHGFDLFGNRPKSLIPKFNQVGQKVVNRIRKFSGVYVTPETAQVYQAHPQGSSNITRSVPEHIGDSPHVAVDMRETAGDAGKETPDKSPKDNDNKSKLRRFLGCLLCPFCCGWSKRAKSTGSSGVNAENPKKEKKRGNCCLIIILIIIILLLLGNVILLDVRSFRPDSSGGNNATTVTTTTPIANPNGGEPSIKSLVCLSLFEGMALSQPKAFPCEYCADDPTAFYNVSQFCVLKGIAANAVNGAKLEAEMGWMANNNFCRWLGVTCDKSNNIIELNFLNPNIPGTIGSDIGKIKTLQKFSILGSNSQPIGALPQSIFDLKALTSLSLTSTNIDGPLPDKFDQLTSLNNLVLSKNRNFGNNIPPSIATLSLSSFIYSGQGGSGSIPDFIGNSKTLQSSLANLDLSSGGFTGMPNSILKLKALANLNLGGNNISGGIPNDIGTSDFQNTLTTLDLSGNQLNGNIPSSISQLTNLNILSLQKNLLTGNIPTSMGQLTKLVELYMNDNKLNGPIPDGVSNLKVTKINLSNNELSGTIPLQMCQRTYNLCDLTRNQLPANVRCTSCLS